MITGNEPAFPMDFSHEGYKMNEGLTIRQQFAMAAMQGMISCPETTGSCTAIAQVAIEYADALIAELNKPTE